MPCVNCCKRYSLFISSHMFIIMSCAVSDCVFIICLLSSLLSCCYGQDMKQCISALLLLCLFSLLAYILTFVCF